MLLNYWIDKYISIFRVASNRFDVWPNRQLIKYVKNYLMVWSNNVIQIFWSKFQKLNLVKFDFLVKDLIVFWPKIYWFGQNLTKCQKFGELIKNIWSNHQMSNLIWRFVATLSILLYVYLIILYLLDFKNSVLRGKIKLKLDHIRKNLSKLDSMFLFLVSFCFI